MNSREVQSENGHSTVHATAIVRAPLDIFYLKKKIKKKQRGR